MPNIQPNFLAIAAATFTCFMLSYVWFTPMFGKVWKKEMRLEHEPEPAGAALFKALGLTLLSVFFMAFVLGNNLQVWMPKTWGLSVENLPLAQQAVSAAFFTWLGFIVPVHLNAVAWSKHSWKLFAINTGYYLVALLLAAFILLAFL